MCAAFGDTPHVNLEILIGQMVNLVRDGQPLRMSKRAGTVLTLDDLVEAIGVDAARYALARYTTDSTIDLDLDLWAKQTSDNPVYYVQYAHARLSSILRNAADLGHRRRRRSTPRCSPTRRRATCCARSPSSRGSSRAPPSCASRTGSRATSRTPPAAFHRFYDGCRVLPQGDEEPTDLHRARLLLVDATRQSCSPTASACSASPPPSGCSGACARTRPAGPHAAVADPRPGVAARARRRQRARAAAVVATALARSTACSTVGRSPAARPRRRARHADVRPRRGRLPGPRPRLPRRRSPTATSTTPARRSCARRSRGGSPRRGSTSTSAPAASWPCAERAGFPTGADRLPRQQQVGRRARRAVELGVGRIIVDSFDEIERLAPDHPRARPSRRG